MQNRTTSQDAAEKAIQLLGGPTKAAVVLNVPDHRYQTVQSWIRTRVPAEWCPTIERATGGQVRCEDLRPDVAWEVLRGQSTEADTEAPQEA
jgi:DNA-binding transcriptional regulator YdaS (Cro superfamily)